MRQILHRGVLQGREPVGDGSSVGAEACVENELAGVRGFSESDRGGSGKKTLG